MEQTINRQMTIQEILNLFPFKAQKLAFEISNAGLHCVGCHAATWETLEAGMYGHGKSDEQINELEARLNKLLQEPIETGSITLTETAAVKFRHFAKEDGKEGCALRFDDRPAGCSGFEYELDFSEKATEEDQVFESQGIEIHVEKNKLPRLQGCEIDYVDGLNEGGFKITNPHAKSSCGCGSSHNY